MAATRVRLIAEYRNGDGNYLYKIGGATKFTASDGITDLKALKLAYQNLLDEIEKKAGKEPKRAGHD